MEEVGGITGYIDVAQVALYTFWLFFAGLIYYLRTQDRREGYPLVTEAPSLANAGPSDQFADAPLTPIGNPLLARVGPGSWAERADEPDLTYEDRIPKIVPLRVATDYFLDPEGADPRGYTVLGADDVPAGEVVDVWVDRNEFMARYFELSVSGGAKRVLVPGPLAQISETQRTFKVHSILAAQFADVPTTKSADQITALEEDYIAAYYAAGTLYATPDRIGPLL
jgi:photosynthetic reaction center H subunit